MTTVSRRSFLTSSAIALSSALLSRGVTPPGDPSDPFQMLVIGDSVMWGQGLSGSKKFWYLTQRWLETDVLAGRRRVIAHVEAHSGATISEKNRTPKIDKHRKFYGEINIGTPTIERQIDDALRHYTQQRIDPASVELVLMNGGANDIGIFRLVNPFETVADLRTEISEACGTGMRGLLAKAASSFPNAKLVVTGYYPIISEQSDTQYACYLGKTIFGFDKYERILNLFLRIFGKQTSLCLTNTVQKRLLDYKRRLVELSDAWYRGSNGHLHAAVAEINAKHPMTEMFAASTGAYSSDPTKRAFFAPVVFGPENCFATSREPDPEINPGFLWQVVNVEKWDKTELDELLERGNCRELKPFKRRILTNDEMYETRQAYCKCRDLEYAKLDLEMCHAAGTGHPNVKGAKEFARSIRHVLSADALYAPPKTV